MKNLEEKIRSAVLVRRKIGDWIRPGWHLEVSEGKWMAPDGLCCPLEAMLLQTDTDAGEDIESQFIKLGWVPRTALKKAVGKAIGRKVWWVECFQRGFDYPYMTSDIIQTIKTPKRGTRVWKHMNAWECGRRFRTWVDSIEESRMNKIREETGWMGLNGEI